MLKLITLGIGLVVGFGGGVMWSAHNPQAAQQISQDEETKFLQAQLAVTQATQSKLDALIAKRQSGNGTIDAQELADLRQQAKDQSDKIQTKINQWTGH